MTSNPSLRDERDRIAETKGFTPDPTDWDRGRRARRRTRLSVGAAALAVLALAGIAWPSLRPDVLAPAGIADEDGAIPSRIVDRGAARIEVDFSLGSASVAFVSGITDKPVVIDAADGRYHHLDVASPPRALALSPDGGALALAMPDRLDVIYLETGRVDRFAHNAGKGANVSSLQWSADGKALSWSGASDDGEPAGGVLEVSTLVEHPDGREVRAGIFSPSGDVVAMPTAQGPGPAEFLVPSDDSSGDEEFLRKPRALASDLYPDGAHVRPLGWAEEDLLLAEIDGPPGSEVEGPHLALLTSPDRPESEWIERVVVRDVPDVRSLSVAVDLIPDLDGTSSQQLTRDFPAGDRDSPWLERAPYVLGGLMALLGGLAFIRMLRHQA